MCSMVGYGETRYDDSEFYSSTYGSPWRANWSTLIQLFNKNIDEKNFMTVQIDNRAAIYDALRQLLSIQESR